MDDIVNKEEFVSRQKNKFYKIINDNIGKNTEKTLAAISACSFMLFKWNQDYSDTFLEKACEKFVNQLDISELSDYIPDDNCVMFYDSFGNDTRGLALIYLKALLKLNKNIIYVVPERSFTKQPEIDKILQGSHNAKKIFFSEKVVNYQTCKFQQLKSIILRYKPSRMFLYTLPYDSAGIMAFQMMKGLATRYQVNLTDHAFWLGINAFDYCVEFRNYGASISTTYRNIPKEKEILLPYYPNIDKSYKFQGLPFEATDKKIIFSGGNIYKTIDKNLTFYSMVASILRKVDNSVFLYAGTGDLTHLENLKKSFPGRVFYIDERKDLFQLLQHITIYINTYPLLGGLMTQYAAVAGKIPLTLIHNEDSSGILIDQDNRKIEYHDPNDLVKDVVELLSNDEYRLKRESLLEGSVMDESTFDKQIYNIICYGKSDYEIVYEDVNTIEFRRDYALRFSVDDFDSAVSNRWNFSLFPYYIKNYIRHFFNHGS